VTVEEILTARNTTRPKVTPGRQNLEVIHKLDEPFPLTGLPVLLGH
jgi:hypothetical protein